MRELLRQMAKAKMTKMGYSAINRRMRYGQWRRIVNAYPVNRITGEKMPEGYLGKKRGVGHRQSCAYRYC